MTATPEHVRSRRPWRVVVRSESADVLGLGALRALGDLELDAGALLKGLKAGAGNGRVVDENVSTTALLLDEAETLVIVEPLDGSLCHVSYLRLIRCGQPAQPHAEDIRTAPDVQRKPENQDRRDEPRPTVARNAQRFLQTGLSVAARQS